MQTDSMHHEQPAPTQSADEMLIRVRRELVGIHAALAERTNSDPEVRPYAVRELMTLIREIRSFQKEQQARQMGDPPSGVAR